MNNYGELLWKWLYILYFNKTILKPVSVMDKYF